jgi:alpha-methylacyl-CoA racemase
VKDASGPLAGTRVLEIASTGAVPFAGLVLADMGADVLRVDRPAGPLPLGAGTVLDRGRRRVAIDLAAPAGVEAALRLVERADALLEGLRPGVAERLGVGPVTCLARNPRLVYGRLTGFGRTGPLAAAPGHDLNYIALAGVLGAIGPREGPPAIPLNLIGDFAGGGLLLAFGVVCALLERARSGRGQVVDAAMVDGAALLACVFHAYAGRGWEERRGANLLDGGAPFYNVYECADGRHVAVAAVEPPFYRALLEALGLAEESLPDQMDPSGWPALRARFAAIFRTRTRDAWCTALEGTDACVSPVLTWTEAQRHPQNRTRGVFVEVNGLVQPGPAPRFGRTPGRAGRVAPGAGPEARREAEQALADWGLGREEVAELRARGAFG